MTTKTQIYRFACVGSRIYRAPILTITPINDETINITINIDDEKDIVKDTINEVTVYDQIQDNNKYPWFYLYANKRKIHHKSHVYECTFTIVGNCSITEDFKSEYDGG